MCCDWLWYRLDSERTEVDVTEGCRGSKFFMERKP
jgi:hypothetical protein